MPHHIAHDCVRCNAKKVHMDILYGTFQKQHYTIDSKYVYIDLACLCKRCNQISLYYGCFKYVDFCTISEQPFSAGANKLITVYNDLLSFLNARVKAPIYMDNFIMNLRPVSITANSIMLPPDHLPLDVERVFKEGAGSLANQYYNASGAMFRLCLDLTTKELTNSKLDKVGSPISGVKNKTIHSRLEWLFDNDLLSSGLKDLAACVKDDGNDAAHDGSLTKADAEDLQDFCFELLEQVYTNPKRLALANQRRAERRQQS